MNEPRQKGFLVLEILIAGLILTASIAASMYLFRVGYGYLEKANWSNTISVKLIQTANIVKILELEKKSGVEDMGDGVSMKWNAQLLGSTRPMTGEEDLRVQSMYELFLYKVNFSLIYQNSIREYQINVFRYKPLFSTGAMDF
jgi:hypothetical protein